MDSELAREKMWARIHLIPALQAEEDRDQVRRYLADKAREKELLGTETKVYHSDRYVCILFALHSTSVVHPASLTHVAQVCSTDVCRYAGRGDEVSKWLQENNQTQTCIYMGTGCSAGEGAGDACITYENG